MVNERISWEDDPADDLVPQEIASIQRDHFQVDRHSGSSTPLKIRAPHLTLLREPEPTSEEQDQTFGAYAFVLLNAIKAIQNQIDENLAYIARVLPRAIEGNALGAQRTFTAPSIELPQALRPYVANPDQLREIGSILIHYPRSVLALIDIKNRYADRPEVSTLTIDLDSTNADPIVTVTLYTNLEGDKYLRFEDSFWDWWLSAYPEASKLIRVAIW